MTHPSRPSTPASEDSLVASYHAAVAELEVSDNAHTAGPSPQVRANIQAYAQQLAEARSEALAEVTSAAHSVAARAGNHGATSTLDAEKPAANDSQWKIRALASIAIFGLSGLLFMQWERAPQDERDVAFSAARPALGAAGKSDKAEAALPASAAPVPVSPPAAAPAPAPAIATAPTSPTAANKAEQAPSPAKARSTEDEIRAEATAGAPNSAKKINREATRSDLDASATATQPFIADSAKDKAESLATRPMPAVRSAPPPAPAPAPSPAPAMAANSAAAPKPDAAMDQSGAGNSAPAAMAKAAPPAPSATATATLAEASTAPRPAAAATPSAPLAPAAAARARAPTYEASTASSIAQSTPQGSLQRPAAPPSPNTALFAAIRNKDAAALQQALNEGADKNTKRNGTPVITLCVQAGQADMVQLLVNAAADVNAADAQGITPLAHARERGLTQIASILLKAGAK
jgi:Ankyrin repeats (3 copies)